MILSNTQLGQFVLNDGVQGNVGVLHPTPPYVPHIGPASIDLTLHEKVVFIKPNPVSKYQRRPHPQYKTVKLVDSSEDDRLVYLEPGEFCLASTYEKIDLSNEYAGFIVGRSSWGRLGLQVENAGFIDPGFMGRVTLELINFAPYPIPLIPNTRICQLVLFSLDKPAVQGYTGKYQGQMAATISKINEEL